VGIGGVGIVGGGGVGGVGIVGGVLGTLSNTIVPPNSTPGPTVNAVPTPSTTDTPKYNTRSATGKRGKTTQHQPPPVVPQGVAPAPVTPQTQQPTPQMHTQNFYSYMTNQASSAIRPATLAQQQQEPSHVLTRSGRILPIAPTEPQ